MKRIACLLITVALMSGSAAAKTGVVLTGTGVDNPLGSLGSAGNGLKALLASGKLDVQHTVGLSFGTGNSGFSQYYMNTLTYKPASKVTVQATLGIQNQVGAQNVFGQSVSGARIVVPNIGMLYQPTPNLRISIGFSNVPAYGTYYDPWGRIGF